MLFSFFSPLYLQLDLYYVRLKHILCHQIVNGIFNVFPAPILNVPLLKIYNNYPIVVILLEIRLVNAIGTRNRVRR